MIMPIFMTHFVFVDIFLMMMLLLLYHSHRWNGTSNGKFVSMGVVSDGSYGVPKDIVFSFPVTTENKEWKIVQGLSVDDFARGKFEITAKELLEEKEEATAVCKL